MLEYLLKSAACMMAFLLFYQLLLEKEQMHHFKRYFLIGALVISLVIPGLVFTEFVEMDTLEQTVLSSNISEELVVNNDPATDMDVVNWSLLLWTLYISGMLLFALRFFKHLYQILRRIQKNPKLKCASTTQVLLKEKMPPHTFFKYIFLNQKAMDNKEIPEEVLLHEETHAKQYHSLDVLFIELLHVILWFNPLLFWFKKSIKLNHEFLADGAVLKKNVPTKNYQNTLLSFISEASEKKYQSIHMANAINYSSIKKRFTVMRKQTSKKAAVIRTLLLIPLTALLVYGFSTTELVSTPKAFSNESKDYTARSLDIEVLEDGSYAIQGVLASNDNFLEVLSTFHTDIPKEIKNDILNIHISSNSKISDEVIWFIYNKLMSYGFFRMVTENQEIIREKGNTPFAIEPSEKKIIQKGASRDQMAEYNALAKKYNEMPTDEMYIKMKEVERMKYIYSLMSDKQRADAEPFPNFPEPPTPPSPPLTPGSEKMTEVQAPISSKNGLPAPPAPPTPPSPLDHVIAMAKKGATFYFEGKEISSDKAIELIKKNKNLNIDSRSNNSKRPTVRISKAPIKIGQLNNDGIQLYEYAKELALKEAIFYFDEKRIPADLALEIIRKNDFETVETLPWTNRTPEVKIHSKT